MSKFIEGQIVQSDVNGELFMVKKVDACKSCYFYGGRQASWDYDCEEILRKIFKKKGVRHCQDAIGSNQFTRLCFVKIKAGEI